MKVIKLAATADKTSLKNKHLRNGDYFCDYCFCTHSILLINNPTDGLVGKS